jgi:hypothetical protein
MQNLLLEIPYKFKKSYGGTPEPQTAQDAPWLRGPSLKKSVKFAPDTIYLSVSNLVAPVRKLQIL